MKNKIGLLTWLIVLVILNGCSNPTQRDYSESSYEEIGENFLPEQECYEIEKLIFCSKNEISDMLSEFNIYEDDNNIKCENNIFLEFDSKEALKSIILMDTGEEWTLRGLNCRMALEEAEELLVSIGSCIDSHNMQATASGLGLEKMGIKRINFGNSSPIGYMEIEVGPRSKDLQYSINTEEHEHIKYPQFVCCTDEEVFRGLNCEIYQTVLDILTKKNKNDIIEYKIECQEYEIISISFYILGSNHFDSFRTINYNLATDEKIEIPVENIDYTDWDNTISWYATPISYNFTYEDQDGKINHEIIWRW